MIEFILCFILPPLAVYLSGAGIFHIILSVILTLFYYVPGVLHALYVVGHF